MKSVFAAVILSLSFCFAAGTFASKGSKSDKKYQSLNKKIEKLNKQVAQLLGIVMKRKISSRRSAHVYRCSPKNFEQRISAPLIANGPSRTETACRIPLQLSEASLVLATFSGHGCHYRKTSGMCWFFIDFGKSTSNPAGASWVGDHRAWALSSTRIRRLSKGKHNVRLRLQASPGAGCHLGNGVLYVAVFPGAKQVLSPSVPTPKKSWACPAKPKNKKALHDAIGKGDTATVECYLKRNSENPKNGITVGSQVDNQRNITLHLAAERCQPAMIRLLMRYGGYGFINATNKHGKTPFAISKAKCKNSNKSEVLGLLRP